MKTSFFRRFKRSPQIFRVLFVFTIILFTLNDFWIIGTAQAACVVSGTVYQDYNASGTQDALEPGVENIRVSAYQTSVVPAGTPPLPVAALQVATDLTDATGNYTLNVAISGQIRIEFTEIPAYLRSGRFGAGNQSSTTTTFVDCSGAPSGIDLAVNDPGEYCNLANPLLGTSCYVLDDQLGGSLSNQPTFYSFPFGSSGDPTPGVDPVTPQALANQIGTTWGLAYHRASDSFLIGSFMKRHTGFGPNAAGTGTTTGGIYRISPATSTTPTVSLFIDLGATTGADPHPTSTTSCYPDIHTWMDCWQYDTASYDQVGKLSLGDVDIGADGRNLYTVNLFTRQLLEIPIVMQATGPVHGAVRSYNLNASTLPGLNDPASRCPGAGDYRPFGLAVHAGRVFVGGVCSAESTQDQNDLRAYVHSFDPLNPGLGFRLDLTFPLNYPRGCADNGPACPMTDLANWQPWSPTWPFGNTTTIGLIYPEPWLTDITFDQDTMVLGFRDRFGDQTGNRRPQPYTAASDDFLHLGIPAGDMLRACPDGAGGWTVEDNATCGTVTTLGADNAQGPDTRVPPAQVGGEYYYQDMNNPAGGALHDEIMLGGIVDIPGTTVVASTAFDPMPPNPPDDGLFDGGVIWFNNDTGARARNYRIFNGGYGTGNFFGKSNGLGDLEAVCGPPPLEIGNRIWEDLDQNGVQDPGEAPLAGVVVHLFMISDSFGRSVNRMVGETTTNANGEYYFNETDIPLAGVLNGIPVTATPYVNFADTNNNGVWDTPIEPSGVMPNAVYEIRLDDPANYGGGVLTPYYITPHDTVPINDTNDNSRDSDGIDPSPISQVTAANFPSIRLRTGDYGVNNHTFDFGFALLPPPVVHTPVVASQGPSPIVTKGVDKPFAAPGDSVTWTITISNPSGTDPLTNVTVNDTLPDTVNLTGTVTDTSPTGTVTVNGQTVTFTQATMAPGEVVVITIPSQISPNLAVPFIIINEIPEYGARAQVISASQLPATGESFWGQPEVRTLILLAGGLLLVSVIGVGVWRRKEFAEQ